LAVAGPLNKTKTKYGKALDMEKSAHPATANKKELL